MYEFIEKVSDEFPVDRLCQTMKVSRSAFYAFRSGQSHKLGVWETQAREQLARSFEEHRSCYGSRRLVAELCEKGFSVGRHRLRRWMQDAELRAIQPRSFVPRTTDSRHTSKPSPNLLALDGFEVLGPNQVLVGDITYLPLKNGKWAYLATWLDLFSRKLVGWHIDLHMRAEIVEKALQNAENRRNLAPRLIVHSDRGSQYASGLFRKYLQTKGFLQ